jgi:hypothetical protein
MSPGKLLGALIGILFALAGPAAIAYGGYWWGLYRPAWHVGWCPLCVGWGPGAGAELASLRAAEAKAAAQAQRIELQQGQITTQAAQQDQTAQVRIVTRYKTLIKEIPSYVTPAVDTAFPIPWSLVRLHDAAARGLPDVSGVSLPAGAVDDAASVFHTSDLAATVAANYQSCRLDAQQLSDLQAWIRAQQAAMPARN